jgi:hypothetical protein
MDLNSPAQSPSSQGMFQCRQAEPLFLLQLSLFAIIAAAVILQLLFCTVVQRPLLIRAIRPFIAAPSPVAVPVAAVGGGLPRESSTASGNSRDRGKRQGPGGNAAGPSRAVKLRKE